MKKGKGPGCGAEALKSGNGPASGVPDRALITANACD
jgi:hypothetical protein